MRTAPLRIIILFVLFSIICVHSSAQSNLKPETKKPEFNITGKYPMVPDSTVVQVINQDTHEIDSTYVMNGEFYFEGHVEYPMILEFRGINYKEQRFYFWDHVFVENSIISMEQKNGVLTVAGSASHDDKKAFSDRLRIIGQKFDAVLNLGNYDRQDSLQLEQYFKESKTAEINFYKNNPDSYFTGYQLRNETIAGYRTYKKMELSKKELREIYAGLTDKIKNSAYGQAVKRYTEMADVPEVGDPYADFTFPNVKGVKVKLSDFKGKYIFVDFWASWCSPCRYQNPKLKRLYEQYKASNFEILGVSIDSEEDQWIKAVEKDKLTWINVLSEGGRTSEVSQLYGINGLPDNLLINPDGVIVKRNIKAGELEEVLANLFSKQ
jgi:peroxiredoxin